MNIEIRTFQTNGIISLVEFTADYANSIDYISGSTAMDTNLIEVKEINQSGSVNNIVIVNKSNHFVFFSDGDIISGAKQNRIFNTSVFIAPNSTNEIPVSCVEQGRWNNVSIKFSSNSHSAPASLRAIKSDQVCKNLELENKHLTQQSKIWKYVEGISSEMSIESPTQNLTDVYLNKDNNFNSFIQSFRPTTSANGLSLFIKKNLLSFEIFNKSDIYLEYFDKLLKAVALDAYHLKEDEDKLKEAEAVYKTNTFFDELDNREFQLFPGVALGQEKRFKSSDLFGLILNYENHLIHLTALSTHKN